MPQTNATAARAAKTLMREDSPSQSEKEGHDDESERSTPQIAPTHMESSSKEGS